MATNNSWNSNIPVPVAKGGTGAVTLTDNALLVGNGTSPIGALAVASTGTVLMGNTGADPSFTGSPSFSGSVTAGTTITATSGAITATAGNVVVTSGDLTLPATTSSVGRILMGGSRWAHAYGSTGLAGNNNFFGINAGNFTHTATNCTAIGNASQSVLSSGVANTSVGSGALLAVTSSGNNATLGYGAGGNITSGSGVNTAVGASSLASLTTGTQNTSVGQAAHFSLATGANCTALGYQAGSSLTTNDSNNIHIGNLGAAGQNNTIRIGTGGTHNTCFVTGIFGVTVGVSGVPVVVDNANQLGTIVSSIRYKDNVRDMDARSEKIFYLNPVTFVYKNDLSKRESIGLIAEDVACVMPDLVAYDAQGRAETVRYMDLPVLLLAELKKMKKREEQLMERIKVCEERLATLD